MSSAIRTLPRQWMAEQLRLGHALCLILDSEGELDSRQALLNGRDSNQFCSVYRETPASDLADAGPFMFVIDDPDAQCISALLDAPERNWGWLASLQAGELPKLVAHWRARLIIGSRPHRALYRFHDNRVLSRALEHLPAEARPAYLGPAISLCYWQGEHWAVADNPAPGEYPIPSDPAWLQVPTPVSQAADIRETNAHRYLLDEHLETYMALADQQDPEAWLNTQLALAEAWGWTAPEQLKFLLAQCLTASGDTLAKRWQARPDETPTAHFERLHQEAQFWQGDAPL
ncbi:DUF4123 domain-containing protein [Pseudomonas chlororaphis]|uniref:DUF4123 domain-containing protein n=1 Tax=Pseudomonas chlororaphis TaxID=587753 RepID=UPI002D794278|nr:DUF4123 domain-containing protein [Pseudomonas chlororaphis]